MKRCLLIALCSCTATQAALDLRRPAPASNICAPVTDPRCAAMFADLALFGGGVYLQATAEERYDARDIAGLTLAVGVLVGAVIAGAVWPERF